jgi:uncharacterized protein YPO0396
MPDRRALEEQLAKRVAELKTLRDEIRVDLHLASMDLKDEWQKIERKLPDPETAVDRLKEATGEALDVLTAELRKFRERLRTKSTGGRPPG